MKTEKEIEQRILKLRTRYELRYVDSHIRRTPSNCIHNHLENNVDLKTGIDVEHELAPRMSTTLVIIQPPKPVRLCMLNASSMNEWNGTICDTDDISKKCKQFALVKSVDQLHQGFTDTLSDDSKTLSLYPDIAALQWVIDDRAHHKPPTWIDKLIMVWLAIKSKWFT